MSRNLLRIRHGRAVQCAHIAGHFGYSSLFKRAAILCCSTPAQGRSKGFRNWQDPETRRRGSLGFGRLPKPEPESRAINKNVQPNPRKRAGGGSLATSPCPRVFGPGTFEK